MEKVTLPGAVQALMMLIFAVCAFVTYLRSRPGLLPSLALGASAASAGFLIVTLGWGDRPTIDELARFQAREFYQGTVLFSLGVGVFVGSLCSWVVARCLRL